MKKIIPLAIAVALLLPSCSNAAGTRTSSSHEGSAISSAAKSKPAQKALLTAAYTDGQNGFATKDGFYYIGAGKPAAGDSGSSYTLIRYLDFKTKQDIVLCNKPNCAHNSDTCNAYLGAAFYLAQLIGVDGVPYLINGQNMGSFDSTSTDSDKTPGVFTMAADGSNRTKILSLPSGMQLNQPYLLAGHVLYAQSSVSKKANVSGSTTITSGGSKTAYTIEQTDPELTVFDLDKKTVKPLFSMKNRQVLGAYDRQIVLSENDMPKNLDGMSNDEAAAAIAKEKVKIITRDIDTGKEVTHAAATQSQMDFINACGSTVCFVSNKTDSLCKLDLKTDKVTTLVPNLPKYEPYIVGIVDGRVIYAASDNKKVNPEIASYYWVDLKTGEHKQLTQFLSAPRDIIRIIGETDTQFIVVSGHTAKLNWYKDPDTGKRVAQYDIQTTSYALIGKENYWNSKAAYQVFKEED